MKKVLLIACCAFAICACSTPEKKAQTLVQDYLKTTMTDSVTYESVSWGTLDSTFTVAATEAEYTQYVDAASNFTQKVAELGSELVVLQTVEGKATPDAAAIEAKNAEIAQLTDSVNVYVQKATDFTTNYVPQFNGWSMAHTFNVKVGEAEATPMTSVFFFDKDLTSVVAGN